MIHLGFLRFRILVVFFIGVFFFLFITGRSLQLQLLPNQRLAELASRQYRTAVTLFPKRGVIYDRNMNELAMSRKVGSIFANPKAIKNPKAMALRLSRLTGVSFSKIYPKLKSKKSFVWIDRLIDDALTKRLTQNPIDGVGIIYEFKRFYDNQELAAQVLGMTGVDSQGIEGVEYGYDKVLQGQKKSLKLMRDAMGRTISFEDGHFLEAQEGNSLVLSIDKSLQFFAEKELEAQVNKMGGKNGMTIVQDSQTGEILAMAHYPFFNPNTLSPRNPEVWKNRTVTEVFEPGSTFKVFLAALALEEGISPQEQFFCENGLFRLNNKDVIREAQNHKYGWLSLSDILKYSSNIGAAKIALQLSKIPFYRKVLEFGFGSKTGMDVPGESSGIIQPLKNWEKVQLSNIGFGQGISVTAIQLVTAMSAIANGGKYMKPFVVKKIIDSKTGEVQETQPQVLRQVLPVGVSRKLTLMLNHVTEKDGTGYLASLEGYKVAGKTGTAQIPNLERGGYYSNKYTASFLGFMPADEIAKQRFTILTLVKEPKKQYYGSLVAAPLFKSVALHTLRLFPIDNGINIELASIPKSKTEVLSPLSELEDKMHMPDLKGRSLREVLDFAAKAGLTLSIKGSGIAVEQSLKAGSLLEAGQKCSVTFKTSSL